MAMEYRGNVIVLDDGTARTEDMVARVADIFPNVLRMTSRSTRGGDHEIVVDGKQFGVRALVRVMAQRDAYWGLIPKNRDPVTVIADFLSEARHSLDTGFPCFVLVATEPGRRYERIAIVADVRAPVTTGALALTGVGLACHVGAELDVLMLGADREHPPQHWHDVEQLLDIRGGAEYLEQALEKARQENLRINWVALGDAAARDQVVLQAVRDGGYDLVLDDLRPLDVGPRIGRLKRVERQLVSGDSVDTAYRLLRDAPCDVGIVVDAVTMNMVPSSAVRVGAVAALSLGVVGIAMPNTTSGSAGTDAAMVASVEAPLDPAAQAVADAEAAAQAQAQAQAEAAVAAVPFVGIPAPSPADLPEEVSDEAYAGYQASYNEEAAIYAQEQAELAAAQQQQHVADTAVVLTQADLALERNDLMSAKATTDSAEDNLAYSQGGKDALTDAEEARAQGSYNTAQRNLQRQQADVKAAEARLSSAREQAAAAAAATAAQQAIVEAEAANMAAWNSFMAEADARTDRVVAPVPGYSISTKYGVAGPYWASGYHTGIDYAAPTGAPVVAAADGVVTFAGWNGAYGNQVKVQHEDGSVTTYAHLSSSSVSVGKSVGAGDQIGRIGSTGNSTGPHLHFELLTPSGGFTNPETWLAANGAA